jgi:hypothetical protein
MDVRMKAFRDKVITLRQRYVHALDEQLNQLQAKEQSVQEILKLVRKQIGNVEEARDKIWLGSLTLQEFELEVEKIGGSGGK